MRILVIDVGGTHVKVLATGHKKLVEFPSGPKMTPAKMVAAVRAAMIGWKYDAVSIGYPGTVLHGCSRNFRPARAWEKTPMHSKVDIAFGPSFAAAQLISGSSINS
jgi:predicted NBD/HSP70 family sugar kinase